MTLALTLAVLMAPASAATPVSLDDAASLVPFVRVQGRARLTVPPDEARLSLAVVSQAPIAREAAVDNARRAQAVAAALRQALGSDARVETIGYALNPRYEFPRDGTGRKLVGYEARHTLEATMSDFERAGAVIDAALGAGANEIQGLTFGLKDEVQLRARALKEAVERARAEADAVAAALGLHVVRVISVVEGEMPSVPPVVNRSAALELRAPSTPVQPGMIEVSATAVLTAQIPSSETPRRSSLTAPAGGPATVTGQ